MHNESGLAMAYTDDRISIRLVREVADELGVDPLDLDPLYDTVDPDVLNELFQTWSPAHLDDQVELTIQGCHVSVYGTGKIEVSRSESEGEKLE